MSSSRQFRWQQQPLTARVGWSSSKFYDKQLIRGKLRVSSKRANWMRIPLYSLPTRLTPCPLAANCWGRAEATLQWGELSAGLCRFVVFWWPFPSLQPPASYWLPRCWTWMGLPKSGSLASHSAFKCGDGRRCDVVWWCNLHDSICHIRCSAGSLMVDLL